MGTQETFYGLVHNKSYFESSINFLIALGPNVRVSKISYLNHLILFVFRYFTEPLIEFSSNWIAQPHDDWPTRALFFPCFYSEKQCNIGMNIISQTTSRYNDHDRLKAFIGHYPAGSSIRCWQHIKQQYDSGRFQDFDHGKEKNL